MHSLKGFREHQQRIAKLFGGVVNKYPKGPDIIWADKYIIECKQAAKSFTMKKDIWEKIYWEAVRRNKIPILVLELDGKDLAIVDLEFIKEDINEG